LKAWSGEMTADIERLDWSEIAVEAIKGELQIPRLSLANDQTAVHHRNVLCNCASVHGTTGSKDLSPSIRRTSRNMDSSKQFGDSLLIFLAGVKVAGERLPACINE
jgi:hypothetical protein